MTKLEMRALLREAIDPPKICLVYFGYDANYFNLFPLRVSQRLFLAAQEDDFILDGWTIRRARDVRLVKIKDDRCLEIARAEGLLTGLACPNIDLEDWPSALSSLRELGRNVIIRHESLLEEEYEFYIGRILRVHRRKVLFRHFDADGIWDEKVSEIPFSRITSITFGSRYVEVFSKYLPAMPTAGDHRLKEIN